MVPGPGGAASDTSDKAAILEAILEFYDQFAKQNPPTPRLQFEAAKASRRVCEAHVWLGHPEKAVAAFRRAVGLLEPLVGQFPEMRAELAMAYAVAPPEAFPNEPETPLQRVTELATDNPWLVATARLRLGLAREQAGDRPGAELAYRDAVASFAAVEPANRPSPGHLELAFSRLRLAFILSEQGKLQPARKVLEESVAALSPAAERGAGEGRFRPEREWLGVTYLALAEVCQRLKDDRAAGEARTKAERSGGFGFGGPGGKKDGPFGPWGGWGGKKDGPPGKK